MKTKPYIPYSIRTKETWGKVGEFLGVHPVVAREAAIDYGSGLRDFERLIFSKQIKKEELNFENFSGEELEQKQKKWEDSVKEQDFSDLLHYRLKSLVKVGDEWVCDESQSYLSGKEYFTRGCRYAIHKLTDDGFSEFGFEVYGNIQGEYTVHNSSLAIKSLWRGGVEIWNWHLEYFKLHIEQNPDHPQTEELRKSCEDQAVYAATGAEYPCKYIIERHKQDMLDPVYAAGFVSLGTKNPYEFPSELSDQRMRLAVKKKLTEEDKQSLAEFADLFQKTEWQRWEMGNHMRKYKYLS